MKLTANRLTLLRILLLPLPCVLLYGGPTAKLTAVGMGSLLGLTDYLDGKLARRQGVTRLGTLLDPIADKIFITVFYLLLAHLRYLPLWLVLLIIFREFLITALRQIVPGNLPVSWLAKLKTSIQMMAVGLIIVVKTFPSWGLIALWITAIFLSIGVWFTNFEQKQKALISLFSSILPFLSFLPKADIALTLGILVLIFTWLSGIQYLKSVGYFIPWRRKMGFLIEQLALPLSVVLLMPPTVYLCLMVVLILIIELIRQGLKLIYTFSFIQEDRILGILGMSGIGLFVFEPPIRWISFFLTITLILDLSFTIRRAYHIRAYLKD